MDDDDDEDNILRNTLVRESMLINSKNNTVIH